MAQTSEPIAASVEGTEENAAPVTAQDLENLIKEFEQYRERLLNETMTAAQRAKLPKKAAMAQIEPELAKIEAALQHLREQQATTSNP